VPPANVGRRRILPPSTETTNGCGSSPSIVPSGVAATNAIDPPSGDHAGMPTLRSGFVSLFGLAVRAVPTIHSDESCSRTPVPSRRQNGVVILRAVGSAGSPTEKRRSPLGATIASRPSGAHTAAVTPSGKPSTIRGSPPSSGRIHAWIFSDRSERNTSRVPSGETRGRLSEASAFVSCSGRPPVVATRHSRERYRSRSIVWRA
jgi:hypothetical protein